MKKILTSRLIFQITLIILLPIVVFGVPARVLDKRLDTSPWALLAALLIAFHVSLVIFFFKFKRILSAFGAEKLDSEK